MVDALITVARLYDEIIADGAFRKVFFFSFYVTQCTVDSVIERSITGTPLLMMAFASD